MQQALGLMPEGSWRIRQSLSNMEQTCDTLTSMTEEEKEEAKRINRSHLVIGV